MGYGDTEKQSPLNCIEYRVLPTAATLIEAGDILWMMGSEDAIADFPALNMYTPSTVIIGIDDKSKSIQLSWGILKSIY